MKIMASHSSASVREETPHVLKTSRTNTIVNALKQRAQARLNDKSLDAHSRAVLRKALETNDPWLAELVRQADADEPIDLSEMPDTSEADSDEAKVEALTEMIYAGGEEAWAALLVLMSTLQNSAQPKTLANIAKHLAFTRCGELNLHDMVDAQVAAFEEKLLD